MYGLGDTKTVQVRFWLWMVFLARLAFVSPNLRCYSSEQDLSVLCDDEEAVCFTVCNRNITIQGCSWGSCQSLITIFPHISDCQHCKEDNCNIEACLDGKVGMYRTDKSDRQYLRAKNSTRFKFVWHNPVRWTSEESMSVKNEVSNTRHTLEWTIIKRTTTENPQTTTKTLSTSTAETVVIASVGGQNHSGDGKFPLPDKAHSDEKEKSNITASIKDILVKLVKKNLGGAKKEVNLVRSDLGNITTLEQILTLLLLLTLLLICLLSFCWMCLCRWVCKCKTPPSPPMVNYLSEKCENVVEDNVYLECENRGPRINLDRIQIKMHDAEDCRTKDRLIKGDHCSYKEKERRVVSKDTHNNVNRGCKKVHCSREQYKRDSSFVGRADTRGKYQNLGHVSSNVYNCSSVTEDTLSMCLHSNTSSQQLPRNAVLPAQNGELKQRWANLPMASSVRFLLVPGYYIQGISMSALQALASKYPGVREKATFADHCGQGIILESGKEGSSQQPCSGKIRRSSPDNVVQRLDVKSSEESDETARYYKHQFS